MANREDEIAELKQMNSRLDESLRRCRALLADCKSKLAANSNEPETSAPDESELG
jgi:hypothetical protein